MDLQADIKWIVTELKSVKDPNLIEAFKNLLKYRKKNEASDWWGEISEEDKKDIALGLEDLEAGRKRPLRDVLSKYR